MQNGTQLTTKTRTRSRSPSADAESNRNPPKKIKADHEEATIIALDSGRVAGGSHVGDSNEECTAQFAKGLFDPPHIQALHTAYVGAEPFRHVAVEKLFQDGLLERVKDECLSELCFSQKETDIYKINQTGDLASLSFLSSAQVARLPSLLQLRDALYSARFRSFLRAVTGCGALSSTKQDMSVNSYSKGCHLLTHDDVIGSRRVSYILYMPLPRHQLWQRDWGGALELYSCHPATDDDSGHAEPLPIPAKMIPPSWNQFIFFETQPGKSFHSVEEVVVGGDTEDGRERLSISGWFHAAQEGEEGYEPQQAVSDVKSSREQLTSTSSELRTYSESMSPPMPDVPLSENHVAFLSEFLNPVYLQPRTMAHLSSRFLEESSLELHAFLAPDLARKIEAGLREMDERDGLAFCERGGRVPPHGAGTGAEWTLKGPPHKWRYCTLAPSSPRGRVETARPRAALAPIEIVRALQNELFSSEAFRAWLAAVCKLVTMQYSAEARRFRPGFDYTLATSEPHTSRLDVVLGLTPRLADECLDDGQRGWQSGAWGGWECYMAPHEEEDDPAIYRSGSGGRKKMEASGSDVNHLNREVANGDEAQEQGGIERDSEGEEDDDGSTLLTVHPGFNRLLLVLRDEGVLHFVKYVSAAAEGSRWDVCGEYEVAILQIEDDDDDD